MNASATMVVLTLSLSLAAVSASPVLAQATPPYKRTILVGGAISPTVNGRKLLAALVSTGASGPNNRWLLRLEPGVYDLAASSLTMKDFVDIEGSGRDMTTIMSKAAVTLLWPPEVTAEMRDLTVRNTATSGFSEGILIQSSSCRLSRIKVLTAGATNSIRIYAGTIISPILTDVEVEAVGSAGNSTATGLFIVTANPVIKRLSVKVSNSQNVYGIALAFGAAPLLDEVEVSAGDEGSYGATGIDILSSSLKLTRSRIVATGHFASAMTHVQGGTIEISYSQLGATGLSTTGMGIQEVDRGILLVEHSTIEGHASDNQGHSIYSAAASVTVAMSRLVGPILNGLSPGDPQSTFICQGAYDETFTALSSSCQ